MLSLPYIQRRTLLQVFGFWFLLLSSFLFISTHAQQSWLDKATIDRFRFPQCVENRTWEQLASTYSPGSIKYGGLGQLSSNTFGVWACLPYHPCLSLVPHAEDDMMCYVFHEKDRTWYPWSLNSERISCTSLQNISLTFVSSSKVLIRRVLVAWYRFETDSTNMLLDHSGHGHNLINRGADFDDGDFKEGHGSFKASLRKSAEFPPSLNLSSIWNFGHGGITVSVWAKSYPHSNYWTRVFSFLAEGDQDDYGYMMMWRWDWKSYYTLHLSRSGQGSDYNIPRNCFDGVWHHYVWSITPDGVWHIYFDNEHVNAGDDSKRGTLPRSANWKYQTLGRHHGGEDGHNGYLEGNIDDFRIYDTALNSSEVDALYRLQML